MAGRIEAVDADLMPGIDSLAAPVGRFA